MFISEREDDMSRYDVFFNEMIKDSEVKREFDALESEFQLIREMIKARREAGLTQKELAERTGLQQSNISRIENGNGNPSLETLNKIAQSLGKKLVISFA